MNNERDPLSFSASEASNPQTTAETLAQIAWLRPDLHQAILANPGCSLELREWVQAAGSAETAQTETPTAGSQPAPVPAPPVKSVEPAPVPTPPMHPDQLGSENSNQIRESHVSESNSAAIGKTKPRSKKQPKERSPKSQGRSRLVAIGAVVALTIGAAAGGFVAGWTVSGEVEARKPSADPTIVHVETPMYSDSSDVPMPDIRGLDEDAARGVLADAGVPSEVIKTSTREAAGPAKVVVEQTPAFGTSNPAEVLLVISTQALVPKVKGLDAAAVIQALGLLGTEVEVVDSYSPDAVPGTALSVVPASGETLPSKVVLTVAEAPSSVFLSGLQSLDGQCNEASDQVDGTSYPNSIRCVAAQKAKESSWVISRAADTFEATVGIPDDGAIDTKVLVEVLADGKVVAKTKGSYGKGVKLSAPISGALRLTIRTTLVSSESDSWNSERVLLGDARLVGSSEAIASLDK